MSRGHFYKTVMKRTSYAAEAQATVDVYLAGTLTRADLWTIEVGGASVDNPILVGSSGIATCWIDSGKYDCVFTGADVQTLFSQTIADYADITGHIAECDLHSCDGILRLESVINNTQSIAQRAISLDATTAQGAIVTVEQNAIWKSL
jgi:hypothetical protein